MLMDGCAGWRGWLGTDWGVFGSGTRVLAEGCAGGTYVVSTAHGDGEYERENIACGPGCGALACMRQGEATGGRSWKSISDSGRARLGVGRETASRAVGGGDGGELVAFCLSPTSERYPWLGDERERAPWLGNGGVEGGGVAWF